jgi:hypothetical protein
MSDRLSRRDLIKTLGAAGAGMLAPQATSAESDVAGETAPAAVPGAAQATGVESQGGVLPLTSTSEVFIPPRGRGFQKFSFDFPEPSIEFNGLRFGFLVFTHENTYGLDAARMRTQASGDGLTLTCDGFVWAGGQQKAEGTLTARFRRTGDVVEWDSTVEMELPIKRPVRRQQCRRHDDAAGHRAGW